MWSRKEKDGNPSSSSISGLFEAAFSALGPPQSTQQINSVNISNNVNNSSSSSQYVPPPSTPITTHRSSSLVATTASSLDASNNNVILPSEGTPSSTSSLVVNLTPQSSTFASVPTTVAASAYGVRGGSGVGETGNSSTQHFSSTYEQLPMSSSSSFSNTKSMGYKMLSSLSSVVSTPQATNAPSSSTPSTAAAHTSFSGGSNTSGGVSISSTTTSSSSQHSLPQPPSSASSSTLSSSSFNNGGSFNVVNSTSVLGVGLANNSSSSSSSSSSSFLSKFVSSRVSSSLANGGSSSLTSSINSLNVSGGGISHFKNKDGGGGGGGGGASSSSSTQSAKAMMMGTNTIEVLFEEFEAYSNELSKMFTAAESSTRALESVSISFLSMTECIAPLAITHGSLHAESCELLNATTGVSESLLPTVITSFNVLLITPLRHILSAHKEVFLRFEERKRALIVQSQLASELQKLKSTIAKDVSVGNAKRAARNAVGNLIGKRLSRKFKGVSASMSSTMATSISSTMSMHSVDRLSSTLPSPSSSTSSSSSSSTTSSSLSRSIIMSKLAASHALTTVLTDGLLTALKNALSTRRREVVRRLFLALSTIMRAFFTGGAAAFRDCAFEVLLAKIIEEDIAAAAAIAKEEEEEMDGDKEEGDVVNGKERVMASSSSVTLTVTNTLSDVVHDDGDKQSSILTTPAGSEGLREEGRKTSGQNVMEDKKGVVEAGLISNSISASSTDASTQADAQSVDVNVKNKEMIIAKDDAQDDTQTQTTASSFSATTDAKQPSASTFTSLSSSPTSSSSFMALASSLFRSQSPTSSSTSDVASLSSLTQPSSVTEPASISAPPLVLSLKDHVDLLRSACEAQSGGGASEGVNSNNGGTKESSSSSSLSLSSRHEWWDEGSASRRREKRLANISRTETRRRLRESGILRDVPMNLYNRHTNNSTTSSLSLTVDVKKMEAQNSSSLQTSAALNVHNPSEPALISPTSASLSVSSSSSLMTSSSVVLLSPAWQARFLLGCSLHDMQRFNSVVSRCEYSSSSSSPPTPPLYPLPHQPGVDWRAAASLLASGVLHLSLTQLLSPRPMQVKALKQQHKKRLSFYKITLGCVVSTSASIQISSSTSSLVKKPSWSYFSNSLSTTRSKKMSTSVDAVVVVDAVGLSALLQLAKAEAASGAKEEAAPSDSSLDLPSSSNVKETAAAASSSSSSLIGSTFFSIPSTSTLGATVSASTAAEEGSIVEEDATRSGKSIEDTVSPSSTSASVIESTSFATAEPSSILSADAAANAGETESSSFSTSSVVRWMTLIEQDVARSYLSGVPFGITGAVLRKRRQLAAEDAEAAAAAAIQIDTQQEDEGQQHFPQQSAAYSSNFHSSSFFYSSASTSHASSQSSSSSSLFFPTVSLASFLSVPQATLTGTTVSSSSSLLSSLPYHPQAVMSTPNTVSLTLPSSTPQMFESVVPNVATTDSICEQGILNNDGITDTVALDSESVLAGPIGVTFGNIVEEEVEEEEEEEEEDEVDEENDDTLFIDSRRSELQLILLSCAASEPDIRYCQGMNFIARLLLELCHVVDDNREIERGRDRRDVEAADVPFTSAAVTISPSSSSSFSTIPAPVVDASNLFRSLLHRNHPLRLHDLFLPSMRTLRLRLYQLDRLLLRRAPELHSHLNTEGVTVNTYASPWLLTLFTSFSVLDARTTYALWDAAIVEGFAPVMRMSLAVLTVLEKFLMTSSMETCLSALQLPRPYIVKALRDSNDGVSRFVSLSSSVSATKSSSNVEGNREEVNDKVDEEDDDEGDEEAQEEALEAWAMNRLWMRSLGNPLLLTSRITWKASSASSYASSSSSSSLTSSATTGRHQLTSSSSTSSSTVSDIESMAIKFRTEDLSAGKRCFVTNEELVELEGDFDALPPQ